MYPGMLYAADIWQCSPELSHGLRHLMLNAFSYQLILGALGSNNWYMQALQPPNALYKLTGPLHGLELSPLSGIRQSQLYFVTFDSTLFLDRYLAPLAPRLLRLVIH